MENELFGHEKGAFTDARGRYEGKFQQAREGTLFLDEVSDLPADAQAKLLRVLQEKEITRLGGSTTIPVDVRIVAATNGDLQMLIQQGVFREDLYYRLNVVALRLAPLWERLEDLPLLVEPFLQEANAKLDQPVQGVAAAAMDLMRRYGWQGNIRELENVVRGAAILCGRQRLEPDDLPQRFREPPPTDGGGSLAERVARSNARPSPRPWSRRTPTAPGRRHGWASLARPCWPR